MKTLAAALLTEYASETMHIATVIKFTRRDAEVFGFAEHDRDLVYSGVTYQAVTGIIVSPVHTSAGLNVANLEISGFLDADAIDGIEHEAGVWDGATFEIFDVIWNNLTAGRNLLLTGEIGEVTREDQKFVAELRGLSAKLQTNFGNVVTPTCPYRFGDSDCGFNLAAVTATGITVTAVASNSLFTATALNGQAADYYTRGTIEFTTGLNTGRRGDIKQHYLSLGDAVIQMQLAFPYNIEAGDLFTVTPGCNKLFKTADGVYAGDCIVKWTNGVNFGGEPEVPLQNKLMQLT
jgi:uncharacterized phage protein (TIGR02218 family)